MLIYYFAFLAIFTKNLDEINDNHYLFYEKNYNTVNNLDQTTKNKKNYRKSELIKNPFVGEKLRLLSLYNSDTLHMGKV